jgi:hypothetical protein
MTLISACYVSRAMGDHDEAILEQARRNNPKLGLTGILVRSGDHWCQVLEGAPADVSNMVVLIADDCRHSEFELLWAGAISHRAFAAWSMASAVVDHDAWRRFVDALSQPDRDRNRTIETLHKFVLEDEFKR